MYISEEVVHDELGPNVKRLECAWHVSMKVTDLAGAAGKAGATSLVTQFRELIYDYTLSKAQFLERWSKMKAEHSQCAGVLKYVRFRVAQRLSDCSQ